MKERPIPEWGHGALAQGTANSCPVSWTGLGAVSSCAVAANPKQVLLLGNVLVKGWPGVAHVAEHRFLSSHQ